MTEGEVRIKLLHEDSFTKIIIHFVTVLAFVIVVYGAALPEFARAEKGQERSGIVSGKGHGVQVGGHPARMHLLRSLADDSPDRDFQKIANELAPIPPKGVAVTRSSDWNQANAMRLLRTAADPMAFRMRISRGAVTRLDLDIELSKLHLPVDYRHDNLAVDLLREWHGLLRVRNPERTLRLVQRAGLQGRTLSFRQYYQNIPVFGTWFRITIDEEPKTFKIRHFAGKYIPDLSLSKIEPVISARQALRRVLGKGYVEPITNPNHIVPSRLWIYDRALTASGCSKCPKLGHDPRLAWRLIFPSPRDGGATTDAFVDAITGEVLFYQPRIYDYIGTNLWIATANNNRVDLCPPKKKHTDAWFDEDGVCRFRLFHCSGNACFWEAPICAEPDEEGYAAFAHAQLIQEFYESAFQPQDDIDFIPEGIRFYVLLDYCTTRLSEECPDIDPPDCPLASASAVSCSTFTSHVFGDDMATMDVMAHEVAHSFHKAHVNYIYREESGAIAEHVADMLSHFACCWSEADCDWMIGEHSAWAADSEIGCGRDLSDPVRCEQPDHYDNGPDHEYVHLPDGEEPSQCNGYGFVHTNNGILNKAGYLLVEGGSHPSGAEAIRVVGLGEDKVRSIYHASVIDLPETPEFIDFADHVYDTCELLASTGGSGSSSDDLALEDCCQVRNAFAAVGVGHPDIDCDGREDVPESVDSDSDGISDADDNAIYIPNALQEDIDGDGIGDVADDDIDGDSVVNVRDNCPELSNPGQEDDDESGIGDACEDWDSDRVLNARDNCADYPNYDQEDSDRDGVGDSCDDDIDGDGVDNGRDNCPEDSNEDQDDPDEDGVGTECDNCREWNPGQEDIDEDGQGNTCDDDLDGDGVDNERDNCPDAFGTGYGAECLEGRLWRGLGCPCGPQYFQGGWYFPVFEFLFDSEQEPDVVPYPAGTTIPITPCGFLPCTSMTLFEAGSRIHIKLDIGLDLPNAVEMSEAIAFEIVILDEAGYRVANDHVQFIANAKSKKKQAMADLSFEIIPSFAWTSGKGVAVKHNSFAAIPAYYLSINPRFGNKENVKLMKNSKLAIKAQVSGKVDLLSQKSTAPIRRK